MTQTIDVTAPDQPTIPSQPTMLRLQDLLASLDQQLREAGVGSEALADLEAARILVETTVQTSFRALIQGEAEGAPQAGNTDACSRMAEAGIGLKGVAPRRVAKGPTPMAIHALGTLRVAANAYTQWDRERGIVYGLGKVLNEYVGATRDEVFGSSEK